MSYLTGYENNYLHTLLCYFFHRVSTLHIVNQMHRLLEDGTDGLPRNVGK